MNKIAIHQPYFAPHIGYFQLINAVDLFVLYDDVNFIKNGWINRNKIVVNGNKKMFTIPLKKQSSFKKINETAVDWGNKQITKFFKTIRASYSNSEYRDDVLKIIDDIFFEQPKSIADLAYFSIEHFCKYLDIHTKIKTSSIIDREKTDDKAKNLINICNSQNMNHYINAIGGIELYDKKCFESHGIKLNFIKGASSLSIIDMCMNTSKEEIKNQLTDFILI